MAEMLNFNSKEGKSLGNLGFGFGFGGGKLQKIHHFPPNAAGFRNQDDDDDDEDDDDDDDDEDEDEDDDLDDD